MAHSKRQKLIQIANKQAELLALAESLHCQCAQCNTFRETGTDFDDLCFQGRRVMQMVYALDVCNDVVQRIARARTWKDFGPHNQLSDCATAQSYYAK